VPDSLTVRARSIVLVGACALVPLGLLATSCGDDGPGDTARFCAEVQAHAGELTGGPAALDDDVGSYVDLYREIGRVAPLVIEPHWEALVRNYETASTVDMTDPESVQRTVAQAYASERSAVAVATFLATNCGVNLAPVATIVPQGGAPAAPATTVAG
jgi:hypothetical protein